MSTEFSLDLRLARRKAGFTQRDCAHLLGVPPAKLSQLESGERLPTVLQICTLSVIYGRSFESLFGAMVATAKASLRTKILTLPKNVRYCAGTRNRNHSIDKLAQFLAEESQSNGAA